MLKSVAVSALGLAPLFALWVLAVWVAVGLPRAQAQGGGEVPGRPATGAAMTPSGPPPSAPGVAAPGAKPEAKPEAAPAHPVRPVAQTLSLSAGGTCLDEARLEARVARWLERDTVDARIAIEVIGGRAPDQVRFVLRREGGPPAERVLESPPPDCDNLHAALALSIALAIDAAMVEHFSGLDDDDLVAVEEPAPQPGLLDSMLPEAESHALSLAFGLAGGMTAGLVTSTAGAARVALYGRVSWLEVRLSGLFSMARDQPLPSVAGTFDVQVWAGRADLCAYVPATRWLAAAGCAGFQAGVFATEGSGFQPSTGRVVEPLWAVGLGLEARLVPMAWLEVALFADLSLSLADRTIFATDAEGDPVDQRTLPPAGVMVGLGPVFRFF